ncbi:MAG: oligosaccharide flippase family protein [Candidatus Acidiferrales bacterium]
MKLSHVLRAVATSWLAVLVNAVVAFLLTPYLLHHLGEVEFGLYTLVTSLTGYYGLFDFGVRSAILRFVSRALALNDHNEINRVVSSAFYFYWGICLLTILATVLALPWLPRIFGVSGTTAHAFQSLFLLAGIMQGLTFPLNVFAGSLDASGRFDQVYMVQTFSLLVRVVVVIAAIRAGGQLFAVGSVVLLSIFLSYVLQIPFALRAIGGVKLNPKLVNRGTLREMFRYASVTIGVGVGDKLKANIFPVIVGVLMNPVAITLISLPTRLLRFPIDGISTMTEIINPASSHLEAREDYGNLRRLLLMSAQGAFLFLAPMAAILLIFGRDLLRLWVGAAYVSAYPLLAVLTLGMGAGATQAGIQSMLFGMGRHKGLIGFRLGEGAAFVVLGGIALKLSGLFAFSVVVSATLLLTSLILVPRHVCRLLGMSLSSYLIEGCLKPCLLAVPLSVSLFCLHSWFAVKSWIGLLSLVAVGGVVYFASLLWVGFRQRKESGDHWTSLGILDVLVEKVRPMLSKLRVFA